MEELRPGLSVKSPLMSYKPGREDNLQETGERIEEEFEGWARGVENFELLDDSIKLYNFESALDEDVENVWLNRVVVLPERNLNTHLDTAQEVMKLLDGAETFTTEMEQNFGLNEDQRKKKIAEYDAGIIAGDYEDRNGEARIKYDEGISHVPFDDLLAELESMDLGSSTVDSSFGQSFETEVDGELAEVTPDLLTGMMNVNPEAAYLPSRQLWMAYGDSENALLVDLDYEPGQDPEKVAESHVIDFDKTRTGKYYVDVASNAVEHFLPFTGVLRPEIPGEAVKHYERDGLEKDVRDIFVRQRAWNQLDDDQYNTGRIRDQVYRIAKREEPKGLYTGMNGEIEQIGKEGKYFRWNLDSEGESVILEELIPSRQDAIPLDDRT